MKSLTTVCIFCAALGAAMAQLPPQLTTLATGLNNPRGAAFGPGGVLYVAEAGQGAGDGQGGFGVGVGFTGSITEIRAAEGDSPTARRLVTGLASVGDTENGFPEAIGPDGIAVQGNGGIYVIIGESALGVMAGNPGLSARAKGQFGHLIRVNAKGGWKAVADVGDYDWLWTGENKNEPWAPEGQFPDANPYGLLVSGSSRYVVDAGANTLNEIRPNGSIRIIAYFPNPMLPLPGGGSVPVSDAVPTCVAKGPDGFLYVGTLAFGANFARFAPGSPTNWPSLPPQSKIYRVDPAAANAMLTEDDVWAAGFSPITAIACGQGALYVTEFTTQESGYQTGDVVRIAINADGNAGGRATFGTGVLHQPNGLALDSFERIYVSNFSISTGSGEVVRVNY